MILHIDKDWKTEYSGIGFTSSTQLLTFPNVQEKFHFSGIRRTWIILGTVVYFNFFFFKKKEQQLINCKIMCSYVGWSPQRLLLESTSFILCGCNYLFWTPAGEHCDPFVLCHLMNSWVSDPLFFMHKVCTGRLLPKLCLIFSLSYCSVPSGGEYPSYYPRCFCGYNWKT